MNTDTILQSKIIKLQIEALIRLFWRRWPQAFEHFELVINASVEEKKLLLQINLCLP
jgi:hypothetical protein